MDFDVVVGQLADVRTAAAIIPVFLDEAPPPPVAEVIEADEFRALLSNTLLVHLPPGGPFAARRVILTGVGARAKLTAERLRRAIAYGVLHARSARLRDVAAEVAQIEGFQARDLARATADALLLGSYHFDQFRGTGTNPDHIKYHPLERATLVAPDDAGASVARLAETVYGGVKLARDLGNEPPATCTPTRLAQVAEEIAQRGGMQLTVLDREGMRQHGMGAILGVSQAAHEEPKFIALEYGNKGGGPTIALVGKGITFDSGGISLKPGERMDLMKMDMMGAAAVLGTMSVLADLKPSNVHVVGIVGATENLPGGQAYKPGDILKAMNGVTIEILNTDAEGRLVLADCLAYAQRYEPDAVIDLATLTGAVVVGLGHHISGMITNNPDLAQHVKAAGDQTGELVWELPLLPEYKLGVISKIADVRNTGVVGRAAGSIIGGAFLERFTGGYPWVHLDIAGVAWAEEMAKPYAKEGASGYGVRLLVELLQQYGQR